MDAEFLATAREHRVDTDQFISASYESAISSSMDDLYPPSLYGPGTGGTAASSGPYFLPGAQIVTSTEQQRGLGSSDIDMAIDPALSGLPATYDHEAHNGVEPMGLAENDMDYASSRNKSDTDDHLMSSSEAEVDVDMNDVVNKVVQEGQAGRRGGRGRGNSRGRGRRGRSSLPSLVEDDEAPAPGRRKGTGRGSKKGIKKGFRKPLDPGAEFKELHTEATTAYIDGDYELAEDLASEAILHNPEMFVAHTLLSQIYIAQGHGDRALIALWTAAHTRPRDAETWFKIADLVVKIREERQSALLDAIYCYSRIIDVYKDNVEARLGRAECNSELGREKKAVYDYIELLRLSPYDLKFLRLMAHICIDISAADQAIKHFDQAILHYQAEEPVEPKIFSWSDANVYAELYLLSEQYELGLLRVKSLSRWLLGHGGERFWDKYTEDDREYDATDSTRLLEVPELQSRQGDLEAHGPGLPLELRVRLGTFRLNLGPQCLDEAMSHFAWLGLYPQDHETKVHDFPDLFKEVGDSFSQLKYPELALQFYEPLRQFHEITDVQFWAGVASCYRDLYRWDEAEMCYRAIIDLEPNSTDAHMEIVAMFNDADLPTRAKPYMDIASQLRARNIRQRVWGTEVQGGHVHSTVADGNADPDVPIDSIEPHEDVVGHDGSRLLTHTIKKKPAATTRSDRPKPGDKRTSHESMKPHFLRLRHSKEAYDEGQEAARLDWMSLAREAIRRFREVKVLYPTDKHIRFYGYGPKAKQKQWLARPSQQQRRLEAGIDVPLESLDVGEYEDDEVESPETYAQIPFAEWLECFLQYALFLAKAEDVVAAYSVIKNAFDCIVWYHDPEALFQIHVVWSMCAIIAHDQKTLNDVMRYFMKEHQFVTDSYRLFAALNRISSKNNMWYNNGPTQKFLLRQVKAVDFSLLPQGIEKNRKLYEERAALQTRDVNGSLIEAVDMDVALLVLYGHVLYSGQSYAYAINYFYRAFALDPGNPMVSLALGLSYIHYALKRQSENRQTLVVQGLSFLHKYHAQRHLSPHAVEQQEAEYNVGKAYHMLGLLHLAIPYYEQALDVSWKVEDEQKQGSATENFAKVAAYALHGIWALNGQSEKAREIAEEYLVL